MDDPKADSPSADDFLRKQISIVPFPDFPTAFTRPPKLEDARVAIVTTAGLMRHGEDPWTHDEAGFRAFADERGLTTGQVSMSLDRVGTFVDRNVLYPIDRLQELVDAGRLGSVASQHISFMGALQGHSQLSTVILDSGPRAAKLLRDDGVDVVIITPFCPACGRTTLLLGHVLEVLGLSTVVLSSNLEIAQRAKAPRALFCDFPLGRPLGVPKDPAFQHRVLEAAFDLLERSEGPVLEIFPEVIKDEADTPVACALPPRHDPSLPASVDEAQGLRPAWDRAREQNGATQIGRRVGVDEIPDTIGTLVEIAEGRLWKEFFATEDELLQSVMDVRIYYEEAATALADHVPAARAAEAWLYQKTETGSLLKRLVRQLRDSGQEKEMSVMSVAYIVPQSQADIEYSPKYSDGFAGMIQRESAAGPLPQPRRNLQPGD
jgi:hypothetical protein